MKEVCCQRSWTRLPTCTSGETRSVHSFVSLSREAGPAEEERLSACALHSFTVHTSQQALVTVAPTHARWLKVARKKELHLSLLPSALPWPGLSEIVWQTSTDSQNEGFKPL